MILSFNPNDIIYQIQFFIDNYIDIQIVKTALIIVAILIIATIIITIITKLINKFNKTRNTMNICICPKCNNKNIAFTEEIYNRANPLTFLLPIISIIAIIITFINDLHTAGIIIAIILLTIYIIIKIYVLFRSRKSHTKAICKECGQIWFLQ